MPHAAAPARTETQPVRARFDRFELDEKNATLACEGKPIALPPTPFAVLCALVRHEGALVTKNALLDEVWGHRFVTESVLKTVIGKLRTALQDDARQPRFIETVSRRGYRFIAPILGGAIHAETSSPVARQEMFVGRAGELARLRDAWQQASRGRRMIVWLAGDPGIGKTTLTEQFISTAGHVTCVRGQCVEQYGSGEPYLPILAALGELCRADSAAVPLLRAVAPAWLLQLPWLTTAEEREVLRRELVGLGPERMLREMAEFIDRYTERAPLLLVTEDLHWSDRSTIQLLDYVARKRGGAHFMWLVTFRLSEVVALDHPLNMLRRELLLHGLAEEVVLDPFSESEVAEYVQRSSPSAAADESFVRALHERTDGLPLFVAHVMSDAARSLEDAEPDLAATHIAALAVPERLAMLIDHYIVRLSDDERSVLAAAAVLGTEFRVDTVAEILGRERGFVAETCDELVRKRLLVPLSPSPKAPAASRAPPPFSFRHALFRQVLNERTTATVRADLHAKAGLALRRERDAGVAVAATELAMHFEQGGEAAGALACYAEAAENALAHHSPAECLMLAERGLQFIAQVPPSPDRDAVETSLATLAGVAAGHLHGQASTDAKAWLQRGYALLPNVPRHRLRALLLHMLGMCATLRGEYGEGLALAESMTGLAASTDDPMLLRAACMSRGQILMLQGRPREAREWLERGLAAFPADAPATEDDSLGADPQVTLLGHLALQLVRLGLFDEARERIAQAHERADRVAQPVAQMIATWCEALVQIRLEDSDRVSAVAARMERLVEKFSLAQGRIACGWLRGWILSRTGKPRDGFRMIREAYEESVRLEMLTSGSEVLGYAAEALIRARDLDAAEEQLEQAFAIAEELGERIYLPELFAAQAAIARARGKNAEANAATRRAMAEAEDQGTQWIEARAKALLGKA